MVTLYSRTVTAQENIIIQMNTTTYYFEISIFESLTLNSFYPILVIFSSTTSNVYIFIFVRLVAAAAPRRLLRGRQVHVLLEKYVHQHLQYMWKQG